jgi:hypothetical protein
MSRFLPEIASFDHIVARTRTFSLSQFQTTLSRFQTVAIRRLPDSINPPPELVRRICSAKNRR